MGEPPQYPRYRRREAAQDPGDGGLSTHMLLTGLHLVPLFAVFANTVIFPGLKGHSVGKLAVGTIVVRSR